MIMSIAINGAPVRRRHGCKYLRQLESLVIVCSGVTCVVLGEVRRVCITDLTLATHFVYDARAHPMTHISKVNLHNMELGEEHGETYCTETLHVTLLNGVSACCPEQAGIVTSKVRYEGGR